MNELLGLLRADKTNMPVLISKKDQLLKKVKLAFLKETIYHL